MKIKLSVLLVLTLVLSLGLLATPAHAGIAGLCTSNPTSGPPGTVFTITCYGLAPNQVANTYLVEPDGRAISGEEATPDGIETKPDDPRANRDGTVTFAFTTSSEDGGAYAQVGTWIIVADNPGGASAQVSVNVTNKDFVTSSGLLAYATTDHRSFSFVGSGFGANEIVNVWLTLPSNCSGTSGSALTDHLDGDKTAVGAVNPSDFNTSLGWDYPGPNPKTNGAGVFTIALNFRTYACVGTYTLTARALGSGVSAEVAFVVNGNSVTSDGASWITVDVSNASARNPLVTVNGYGFPAGAGVNCWGTRPDGRAMEFGNAVGSSFSLTFYLEDVDTTGSASDIHDEAFSETAEPGLWYMTCATPNHSSLATASFTLSALTIDP